MKVSDITLTLNENADQAAWTHYEKMSDFTKQFPKEVVNNTSETPDGKLIRFHDRDDNVVAQFKIDDISVFDGSGKGIVHKSPIKEDLHKWFKEKWVRFGPNGKIRGDCARGDDSEGKPKCLPQSKAHSLGKEGRASAARRKRREDPNPERSGKAINVNTKKKTNEGAGDDNLIAQKLFFARSNVAPKGWSYDHVGFVTKDGKQIQMSGHKGNDVYITNSVTDDPEFPEQQIKVVSLSKPVSVPTTNSVGAENCGTFVANVLQANGIKGIDTEKLYSVFKQPRQQGVAEDSKPSFMKSGNMKPFSAPGKEVSGSVHALENALLKAKDKGIKLDYDTIDKIMQLVCKKHHLTGDELHDKFVEKHRMIPDKWIVNQLTESGCQDDSCDASCPHCGGEMVSEELMNEKKDACYYKVKSRYKVWPSAYGSGSLVQCRKKGAKNWGNKSESVEEAKNLAQQAEKYKTKQGVAEGYQDDSKEREENLRYSRSRNPVADAIRNKLNPNTERKGNWYIRIKGKVLTDKRSNAMPFPSKEEASRHAHQLSRKQNVPLSAMRLTQSWMDAPEVKESEQGLTSRAALDSLEIIYPKDSRYPRDPNNPAKPDPEYFNKMVVYDHTSKSVFSLDDIVKRRPIS